MAKKLDEILAASGTATTMSPPRDEATWHNLLRQLQTQYKGPAGASKEPITNALDAKAPNITYTITRKSSGKHVATFEDDGLGMFLPPEEAYLVGRKAEDLVKDDLHKRSILRLWESIGNSGKVDDADQQGEKAIGALFWGALGNKVTFISKHGDNPTVAWTCEHMMQGGKSSYRGSFVTETEDPRLTDFRSTQGTTVIVEGINDAVLAQLKPALLTKKFGSWFRDPLRDGTSNITVKDNRGEYVVEPEEYMGTPVVTEEIPTKYGPIAIEIYARPSQTTGEIRLKQGIQTLIDSFGKQYTDVLESESWSAGVLSGQVRADWLSPAAGREALADDDKSQTFFEALRTYNAQLEQAVATYKAAVDPAVRKSFYTSLTKIFKELCEQDDLLEQILSGEVVTQRGTMVDGSSGEGYAPPVGGPGMGSQRRKSGKPKKRQEPYDGKTSSPVDDQGKGQVPTRKSRTLRFNDEDLKDPRKLSKYEDDTGVIVFNNAVDAWAEAVSTARGKAMYCSGLIGKELLGTVYTEPKELADEVIMFQQAFMKLYK
ncbi:MAG: ATP-binding protein [Nanoarchaeota archaeon]|nr:ATP-binding protein [Nanoarchaeota archaeon]